MRKDLDIQVHEADRSFKNFMKNPSSPRYIIIKLSKIKAAEEVHHY